MNNNITEDYVSFEVAKLLKEKGFKAYPEYNRCYIELATNEWREYTREGYEQLDVSIGIGSNLVIIRPTQNVTIKWIRENFGIHITSQPIWYSKNTKIAYFYLIYKNPEEELGNNEDRFSAILEGSHQEVKGNYINDEKYDKLLFDTKFAFNSPEEAIEAALRYCLENLI